MAIALIFAFSFSAAAQSKVLVGSQTTTLTHGSSKGTTYIVTTSGVNVQAKGKVEWYTDAACTTPAPSTIKLAVSTSLSTGGDVRILTVKPGNTQVNGKNVIMPVGSHYFRVTIDGQVSNIGTYTVEEAPASRVSVSMKLTSAVPATIGIGQSLPLKNGAGTAEYFIAAVSLSTKNAQTSIEWYADEAGTQQTEAPAGVTVRGWKFTPQITLTLEGGPGMASGKHYFRVTINGVQSNNVGILEIQ